MFRGTWTPIHQLHQNGDSSAQNALCDLCDGKALFPEAPVIKTELFNHMMKRMDTQLRKLTKGVRLVKK